MKGKLQRQMQANCVLKVLKEKVLKERPLEALHVYDESPLKPDDMLTSVICAESVCRV
jgi:hypothetical protein